MTRFARAKGSKSSNERVPEQATSWSDMRKSLQRESVRKAAEEQIEREQQQQSFNKTARTVTLTKKKITEPVELVSFDDIPGDSKPVTSTSSVFNKPVKQNAPKEAKNNTVLKKKSINSNDSDDTNSNQTLSENTFGLKVPDKNDDAIFQGLKRIYEQGASQQSCAFESPKKKVKFNNSANEQKSTMFKKQSQKQFGYSEEKVDELSPDLAGSFKGYPVPVEDAETLTDAYNILRKEGLTHKQAMERIKPERRRAEKRLARLKSTICFRCRKPGHRLSDCPLGGLESDVCFKCGSTTHKYQECKKKGSFVNAKCFICGVVGHLSGQCPENSHGVYPEGGECKICGEKSHLVKDCPENRNKKEHPGSTEFDDYFEEKPSETIKPKKKRIKKVQF